MVAQPGEGVSLAVEERHPASFALYNTPEEVDALGAGVAKVLEVFA